MAEIPGKVPTRSAGVGLLKEGFPAKETPELSSDLMVEQDYVSSSEAEG